MTDQEYLFEKYDIYPGYASWFKDLEFPLLRKKSKIRNIPRIEVGADGMRVGKTTAVKVLIDGFKKNNNQVMGSYEDFVNNPYLEESYSDPKNAILHSQQWFATRKYNQLKSAPTDKIFIQDVHPEMDFCYAVSNALMGRMSLHQFEEYKKHYYSLDWKSIPQPNLLVYLKVNDDKLLSRVKKSLREFETVNEKYFLIMKLVNRAWYKQAKNHMNILEIDTNNLDFSSNKNSKDRLVSMVEKRLSTKKNKVKKNSYQFSNDILNKKLIIMCGLQGSGKSYLAKKLKKDHGYHYLSSDKIRKSRVYKNQSKYLDSEDLYFSSRKLVYDLMHKNAINKTLSDKKVVLDATYLGPQLNWLKEKLVENNLINNATILVIKTSKEIIESRIKSKSRKENNPQKYIDGWDRAYSIFTEKLSSKEFRYPDESIDGIKVIEVWNQ